MELAYNMPAVLIIGPTATHRPNSQFLPYSLHLPMLDDQDEWPEKYRDGIPAKDSHQSRSTYLKFGDVTNDVITTPNQTPNRK